MYPLVVIIGTAIVKKDVNLRAYALPLTLIGLGIAVYHNLLYYGIIPESITPCTAGVSCTSRQITWLGFITIPFLALVAFIVTAACLVFYKGKKQ